MWKVLRIVGVLVAGFLLVSAPSAAQEADQQSLEAALDEAYGAQDWERARKLARRLAEATDDPYYDGYYGSFLVFGYGGPAAPERGAELIERAARAGDLDAQAWFGNLYVQGLGVERNVGRGVCILRHAGMRGSLEAIRWFIADHRKAAIDYRSDRKLFDDVLSAAGDPLTFFADALYLLGNETQSDDVEGLTHLIIAGQRVSDFAVEAAAPVVKRQMEATITDFRRRGLGASVEEAMERAAKRTFTEPERKPDQAERFAACFKDF